MDKERKEKTARVQDAEADGIIEGRNAVIEALRAGTTIDKIFIQKGETDKTLGHIASTARAAGVVVVDADKRKLDFMSRTHAHQGVIALTSVREYVSVEDILNIAREKGENPLIVVCDEISDPHNLGAIIRTAECAGAHGVVIPKRRSAGLTSIVAKTSAGAVSYVPVARVPNIPALLEQLQKEGVWVFGTAAEGTSDLYSADLKGPAAIVIGSEGDGMTRLVREKACTSRGFSTTQITEVSRLALAHTGHRSASVKFWQMRHRCSRVCAPRMASASAAASLSDILST